MIRTAILVAATLALSACAGDDTAYTGQSPSDAQTSVMLGTAFLNGFNGARQISPVISTHCTAIGGVVNCISF